MKYIIDLPDAYTSKSALFGDILSIPICLEGGKRYGIPTGIKLEPYTEPDEDEIRQKTGKWIVVHGYATPGGDPVWRCSECGKGQHVYGIENSSYGADIADHQWVACPNCGAVMVE